MTVSEPDLRVDTYAYAVHTRYQDGYREAILSMISSGPLLGVSIELALLERAYRPYLS